jgi:hypothetical protein
MEATMPNDNKGDPHNLDIIRMVQKARMMHDKEAVPSKMTGIYWIECKREEHPTITPRTGEFRVTTTLAEVDALWAKIKEATETGKLGYKSKVSTVSPDKDANHRLICVRSYDADDSADVERIRLALEGMGLSEMVYQRD